MSSIIGNVEAIIAMYAPVVGTYIIQIVQWLIMWAKMKAQTKSQEMIQKAEQDKLAAVDDVLELNKQLSLENYELKQKLNKLITLLQHYEEKDDGNKEIKEN